MTDQIQPVTLIIADTSSTIDFGRWHGLAQISENAVPSHQNTYNTSWCVRRLMQTFTSVDLQKRTGDVQRAALRGPVTITVHGTPRTVMLPIEQFEGLSTEKSLGVRHGPMNVLSIPARLINKRMDRFAPDDAQEIVARAALAIERAAKALDALDILGIRAWVIGSLARGTFNAHSDVDFVVDAPPARQRFVLLIIEEAMKNMPFDLVPFDRIPESDRGFFMEGSLDASGFRSRFAQTGTAPEGTR